MPKALATSLLTSRRRYTPALDAFVKIARLRNWKADLSAIIVDSAQVISLDAPSRLKIDGLPASATENSTPFFSGAGHRALMHDVTRFMEVHNQSLSVAFPIFISACVRTLGW